MDLDAPKMSFCPLCNKPMKYMQQGAGSWTMHWGIIYQYLYHFKLLTEK